jgi:hypothetical protein
VLDRLRPHPHRGDVIAAGAVPLALAAFLIALRMSQWGVGARFAVVGLIAVVILTMGWLAPLERPDGPRAYHSMLLVAGLLPLAVALVLLSEVLGASSSPGDGAIAWTFAAEAATAALAARRTNSGACTLIAALAGSVATEAFVSFAFNPQGLATFRAFLLVLTVALVAGAVRLRDRRRRHAVQLGSAGGLLTLVLAATFVIRALSSVVGALSGLPDGGLRITFQSGVPWGWKLYILVVGLALVAYAAADREPGPAYIGFANLLAFALLDGLKGLAGHTLVGWPLLLLVVGGAGLAVGLRPMQPLPPEPPTRPLPPKPTPRPEDPEP